MKILSTEAIRDIDRYTIEREGVESLELIHRVADAVAAEVASRFSASTPVTVFAGPGNNGADALIAALRLYESGFRPEVYLFNIHGSSLSPDCRECREEVLDSGFGGLIEITEHFDFPSIPSRSVIIDGLFGSGLRSPLSGGYTTVVQDINDSGAWILSIDIPSGMFGDWNCNRGVLSRNVVHADLTVGIQFPKMAFFLADNAPLLGKVKLVDIGLSQTAAAKAKTRFFTVGKDEAKSILRPRADYSSKADYGSALLIAGCYGMMGAAVLGARGALRAGVGKMTVHSARCGYQVLQTAVPEAMFSPDASDILVSDMTPRKRYTAIGIGPGLGTNDATRGSLETLLKTVRQPLVLDADALNILARTPGLADHLTPGTILTPHEGEFDRLFGQQISAEARLLKAIEMAKAMKVIIVLKGHHTATVWPDEEVLFNTSGSPAMATGGSGDVLTGVITSFLAQGYQPQMAAVLGVYVHGASGDIAAREQGTYGVTAGDIAACIGRAIKELES